MKNLFWFFVLLSISCKTDEIQPERMSVIIHGDVVGFAFQQEDHVITSQIEWSKFIKDHNQLLKQFGGQAIEESNIDFKKFNVIVVFDALKPFGGYGLEITSILEDPIGIEISMRHIESQIKNSPKVTQPFYIAKILASNKPITIRHYSDLPYIYPNSLAKGSLSGNENIPKQNIVITNANDWNILLERMNSYYQSQGFKNSFSEIDFDKDMVIAVFDDVQNHCCDTIDITEIFESESNVVISVRKLWFGASSAIAQPFHIVKIAKNTKPIKFNNNL